MTRHLPTHLALWAAVALLHAEGLSWWAEALRRPEEQTRAALTLVGLAALVTHLRPSLHTTPRLPPIAIGLWLVAAVGQHTLPSMGPLSATWALLAVFGTVCTLSPPATWHRVRWALPLGLLLLPVSSLLDLYLGFPARQLAASTAAHALSAMDVLHVQTGTVLAAEGAVAYVDAPCSGVQSLWAGALLWTASSAMDDRHPGIPWLLAGGAYAAAILAANTGRVVVIIGLTQVAQAHTLAEALHLPLGLVGFGLATAPALALLHRLPRAQGRTRRALPAWPLLATVLLARHGAEPAPTEAPEAIELAAPWQPQSLTELEQRFAAEQGATLRKARRTVDGLTVTVLLNTASSWRGHHLPRQCLTAAGLTLVGEQPGLVGAELVRTARAQRDHREGRALWWFQSGTRRTDDHITRIWEGGDAPWTLVSILSAQPVDLSDPRLQQIVDELRRSLESSP